MYWTIPLNPNVSSVEDHMQRLQKYMMVSKPIVEPLDDSIKNEQVIPKDKEEIKEIPKDKEEIKEISKVKEEIKEKKEIPKEKKEIPKVKEEILKEGKEKKFTPIHQDTLFWCLFIAKYGYHEYLRVEKQHGRKEMEEKTKIAEFVGKKKNKLSEELEHKITNVFCQEMVTDLLTKPIMPISSIYGFCCFYECSFLIINEQEKTYLSFSHKQNSTPIPIYIKQNRYSIHLQEDTIKESLSTYIAIQHYEKPLRAISHYTKMELEEIAEKINFPIPEKIKKNELYQMLWCKLAWTK